MPDDIDRQIVDDFAEQQSHNTNIYADKMASEYKCAQGICLNSIPNHSQLAPHSIKQTIFTKKKKHPADIFPPECFAIYFLLFLLFTVFALNIHNA